MEEEDSSTGDQDSSHSSRQSAAADGRFYFTASGSCEQIDQDPS